MDDLLVHFFYAFWQSQSLELFLLSEGKVVKVDKSERVISS